MDQTPKQRIVEKLKNSSSVLICVSNSPNVDQLCGALGLVLMLSALEIHSTAIVSGAIPNALEFLHPEKTFDQSIDVLRDFIISIDKEKASKLRYKPEENVVKIFITPYKSQITEADLTFSQGDANVDTVIALGVISRKDLDNAVTAHGRILHDATVASITAGEVGEGDLASINWNDPEASGVCEMLVSMSEALASGLLDEPMSTALLTGIVSVTDRFSNTRTTPKVMTMAAQLMGFGANQQLIAKNLKMDAGRVGPKVTDLPVADNGVMEIELKASPVPPPEPPVKSAAPSVRTLPQIEHDLAQSTPPMPAVPSGNQQLIKNVRLDPDTVKKDTSSEQVLNAAMPPVSEPIGYPSAGPGAILEHPAAGQGEPDILPPDMESSQVSEQSAKETVHPPAYDPQSAIDQAREGVHEALAAAPFDPSSHPLQSMGATPMEATAGSEDEISEKIRIDDRGKIYSDNSASPLPEVTHSFDIPPPLPDDPSIMPPPPLTPDLFTVSPMGRAMPDAASSQNVAPPVAPPLPPKPEVIPPPADDNDLPVNPLFGGDDLNPPSPQQ